MEDIHVLVLSPLRSASGNLTTANRISSYLANDGFECTLRDPSTFSTLGEFTTFICEHHIDVVIGLHALHTSAYLKACGLPFVLVFGGTDINEYSKYPRHYNTMTELINNAQYLVAFSQEMVTSLLTLWPFMKDTDGKLKLIPQGVVTKPSDYDLLTQLRRHIQCDDVTRDLAIYTLVAGIRPVKDPLFLVDTFSDWHVCCQPDAYLVIIGPVIDEDLGIQFTEHIKHLPGIVYLGALDQTDTYAAIRGSTALLNSSLSEGNSMALLEAMSLGTPVIVRDIPGNCGLVEDRINGLIYHTPQDFIMKAEQILHTPGLREQLTERGKQAVRDMHDQQHEAHGYRNLVRAAATRRPRKVGMGLVCRTGSETRSRGSAASRD